MRSSRPCSAAPRWGRWQVPSVRLASGSRSASSPCSDGNVISVGRSVWSSLISAVPDLVLLLLCPPLCAMECEACAVLRFTPHPCRVGTFAHRVSAMDAP